MNKMNHIFHGSVQTHVHRARHDRMAYIESLDHICARERNDVFICEAMSGMHFEPKLARPSGGPYDFLKPARELPGSAGVRVFSSVKLDTVGADFLRYLYLPEIRIDEQTGFDTPLGKRSQRGGEFHPAAHDIETTLRGHFLTLFRNKRN